MNGVVCLGHTGNEQNHLYTNFWKLILSCERFVRLSELKLFDLLIVESTVDVLEMIICVNSGEFLKCDLPTQRSIFGVKFKFRLVTVEQMLMLL